MRVAFVLSNVTYPPLEGLHQQTVLQLKELAKAGIHLDVFGYCRDLNRVDFEAFERETTVSLQGRLIEDHYPSLARGFLNRLGQWIPLLSRTSRGIRSELFVAEHDIIHLDGAAAAGLVRKETAHRTLISLVDPGSRRFARFAHASSSLKGKGRNWILASLYYLFEVLLRGGGSTWHVVSPADAEYLRRMHRRPVRAVPIMLPAEVSRNCPPPPAAPNSDCLTLTLYSDLRHGPSRTAATEFLKYVLPTIHANFPIHLVVMGRVPRDEAWNQLTESFDVTFEPWVDDYVASLRRSDVVVLPDGPGTGLKNRAIQSMALGLATIGTESTFEGIPIVDGVHAIRAPTVRRMLDPLLELCGNPSRRTSVGNRARALAQETYGATAVRRQWVRLYSELAGP